MRDARGCIARALDPLGPRSRPSVSARSPRHPSVTAPMGMPSPGSKAARVSRRTHQRALRSNESKKRSRRVKRAGCARKVRVVRVAHLMRGRYPPIMTNLAISLFAAALFCDLLLAVSKFSKYEFPSRFIELLDLSALYPHVAASIACYFLIAICGTHFSQSLRLLAL